MKPLLLIATLTIAISGCSKSIHSHDVTDIPKTDLSLVAADGSGPLDQMINRNKAMIKSAPDQPMGYNNLGLVLMQRGRETGDLQNYVDALAAFQKAESLDPKAPEAKQNLAWAYTMFHRFEEARTHVEEALAINNNSPFAFGVLTDCHMEVGNYDAAAEAAQKMVNLRPDLSSLSRVAQLKWIFGDAKGASLTMMRAIQAGGAFAEQTLWCQTQLADMQWKTGGTLGAEKLYRAVLKTKPDFRHAHYGLARVEAQKNNVEKAIEHFEMATKGNSPIPYLTSFGQYLMSQDRHDRAEAIFKKIEPAVEQHKQYGISGDEIALIEFWLARGIESKRALELASHEADHHTTWQAYSALAWAQYANKDYAAAWKTIQKAQKNKVQEAELFYRASKIAEGLKRTDDSRQLMAAAYNLNPHFDIFSQGRGNLAKR